MKLNNAAHLFAALSHQGRLLVFRTLLEALQKPGQGISAGDLAEMVNMAPSTLSFHLKDLRIAGLVESTRYGRQVIYTANQSAIDLVVDFLTNMSPDKAAPMARPYNVLFLCTGNSARSLMAESILRHLGQGRFNAFSAGTVPRTHPHPLTLETLAKANYPVNGLECKSWDSYVEGAQTEMDFVFTVCDAAAETCPAWPGQPVVAHWGIPDPAATQGTEAQRALAFADAFRMLFNRVSIFVNLPLGSLDKLSLKRHLDDIGGLAAIEPKGSLHASDLM